MDMEKFSEMYGRYLDTSSIQFKKLDIEYGKKSSRNKLDIYYPEDFSEDKLYPTVIFFHGGGFFKGDKGRYQLLGALQGVKRGYAVVSVNYRLITTDPFPGYLEDALGAMRFIQNQGKKYQLDTDKLVTWGESAGAYLALMTGLIDKETIFDTPEVNEYTDKPHVKVMIDWYGVGPHHHNPIKYPDIVESDLPEDELKELYEQSQIANYISKDSPAILIQHGTADELLPLSNSVEMKEAFLKCLDADKVEYDAFEGFHHGVAEFTNEQNMNRIFEFIEKHIEDERS